MVRSIAPISASTFNSVSPCPPRRGFPPHILDPIKTWASRREFEETAKRLVDMFKANFAKFERHVDDDVREAGPRRRTRPARVRANEDFAPAK